MKTSTILFSAANLIGLLICVLFVVRITRFAKMEERDYYDAGDSFAFLSTVGPAFLVCSILNVLWGFKALVDMFDRDDYQASLAWVAVAIAWSASYMMMKFVV